MTLSQNNLQDMMDRIQKLMEEGRMAEAQQALDELQEMMENMQIAQGEGGRISGDQATEGLSETLREQQRLSDEAFRQLQDQTGREGQQSGQSGETDRSGQSEGDENASEQGLAERQGDLRGQLGNQRDALSELDGEAAKTHSNLWKTPKKPCAVLKKLWKRAIFRSAGSPGRGHGKSARGLRNLSRSLAQGKMPRPKRAGPAHQDSVLSNRIHWEE